MAICSKSTSLNAASAIYYHLHSTTICKNWNDSKHGQRILKKTKKSNVTYYFIESCFDSAFFALTCFCIASCEM